MDEEIPNRKKHVFWTKEKAELCENLYESGETPKRIAQLTAMSVRSVQIYINDHISDTEGQPWKPFEPIRRTIPVKRRLVEAKIIDIINDDCTLTQAQMIDMLPQRLKVCRKTVGRAIKDIGYTKKRLRKVPVQRNTPETIQVRKQFAQKVRHYTDDKIYYLDETGFNLHTSSNYGYALAGETPTMLLEGNRGRNISVLMCISKSGVVHHQINEGAYTTALFLVFIEELIEKLPNNGTLLVMDNVAFHKSNAIRTTLDNGGYSYEYLPPYTPQLNPIEEFFASLKAEQKRIRPRPKDKTTLIASINKAIEVTQDKDCSNYYKHMREYLQKALNCTPFM